MPLMSAADLGAFVAREFPQIADLNLEVEDVTPEGVSIRMAASYRHLRPGGTVSGPTLMALADCAMYLAILSRLGPVALAVTTNLNINFLRKPELGDVQARARILKLGRRLAVGEVSIFGVGHSEMVAHATLTYSIPPAAQE